MKINMAIMLFVFTLSACGSGDAGTPSLADCPHPVPSAVFSDTLAAVVQHRFQLKPTESVEEVSFANGVNLTLIQSGCEARRQSFRFQLPGENFPANDPGFWITQTIEQLKFLASLSPIYQSLSAWSQVIEQQEAYIQLGEPFEVQPGFFIEIDKIQSAGYANLLLTLSESR